MVVKLRLLTKRYRLKLVPNRLVIRGRQPDGPAGVDPSDCPDAPSAGLNH